MDTQTAQSIEASGCCDTDRRNDLLCCQPRRFARISICEPCSNAGDIQFAALSQYASSKWQYDNEFTKDHVRRSAPLACGYAISGQPWPVPVGRLGRAQRLVICIEICYVEVRLAKACRTRPRCRELQDIGQSAH